MRTFLLSMLLVAAPAAADPPHDRPAGSATIDVTELTISGGGGVDPTIMQRAFDATIDAAYRCYDSVQPKPAKLSATVTLRFRIDDHGAVAKASAVGLPSVNNCIATAIEALVFDPPNQGAMDLTEKLSFWLPRTVGILGSLARPQGGAFGSLTGTGVTWSGLDHGGLLGNEVGKMNGGFGAGGIGYGTLGGRRVGRVVDGDPKTPADKDAIRAGIRKNIATLQHCYETELVADPQLAGSATVDFRIEPDGKVSSATGSGLVKVDECIAKAIAAIAFPSPSTGRAIDVSYPFVFKAEVASSGYGIIGSGRFKGTHAPVPTVSIGQPNAQGDLDKAIIRRYIKRNIQKIQYCYERQLTTKPKLAGTVHAQFTIGVDGKVTSSTGAGVDAAVASCVAEVIQDIEFPKPKNNGVVTVRYPFVFRPGDDNKKP